MIILHSVTKKYTKSPRLILDEVSAVFKPRSHVAILGPRYSGKSTLLRILCGMSLATEGKVERRGAVSFPIGFLGRVNDLTVGQVIKYVARSQSADSDELLSFVAHAARLEDKLDDPIAKLPRVLRLRLGFTLGLSLPFEFYLFDERVGAVPPPERELFNTLYAARRETAGTILATSSPQIARKFCEEGAILFQGGLTFYPSIQEAIAVFNKLPKAEAEPKQSWPEPAELEEE